MKSNKKITLLVLILLIGGITVLPTVSRADVSTWTEEEFDFAFDEVARNYGAAEYAIYTFMVEYGRSPESIDELRVGLEGVAQIYIDERLLIKIWTMGMVDWLRLQIWRFWG